MYIVTLYAFFFENVTKYEFNKETFNIFLYFDFINLTLYINIYVYIYICVCLCVFMCECVCVLTTMYLH